MKGAASLDRRHRRRRRQQRRWRLVAGTPPNQLGWLSAKEGSHVTVWWILKKTQTSLKEQE
jgi:hypothetical protein